MTNVLLLERNDDVRKTFTRQLTNLGHIVLPAPTQTEATKQLSKADLLLIDDDNKSYAITAREQGYDKQIVLLSASGDVYSPAQLKELSIAELMEKPLLFGPCRTDTLLEGIVQKHTAKHPRIAYFYDKPDQQLLDYFGGRFIMLPTDNLPHAYEFIPSAHVLITHTDKDIGELRFHLVNTYRRDGISHIDLPKNYVALSEQKKNKVFNIIEFTFSKLPKHLKPRNLADLS